MIFDPKMVLNSSRIRSKTDIRSCMFCNFDFGLILGRILRPSEPHWLRMAAKNCPKSLSQDEGVTQLFEFILQRSSKSVFDRFWIDFGPNLGGKLGPSWHQNPKNEGTKTMSKNL